MIRSKNELNLERDEHDVEDGTLSSYSSTMQRAMKLGLEFDKSGKMADSSIGFGATAF